MSLIPVAEDGLKPGQVIRKISETEVRGKRLGRHLNHDPESLLYLVRHDAANAVSTAWQRKTPVLDQGNLGSCTGNGAAGVLGTEPFYSSLQAQLTSGLKLDENEAVTLYEAATRLDPYPGQYPPTDTGSDGLSVAKACKAAGLISGYLHITSLDALVTALQSGPVIVGVNWYDSFDNPDSSGDVTIPAGASVRGGHEFEVRAVDVAARRFTAVNSWGTSWGVAGEFFFNYDTMTRLLSEQGDATSFVPVTSPAPTPNPPGPTPTPTPTPTGDAPRGIDRTFNQSATAATKRSRAFKTWHDAQTGW